MRTFGRPSGSTVASAMALGSLGSCAVASASQAANRRRARRPSRNLRPVPPRFGLGPRLPPSLIRDGPMEQRCVCAHSRLGIHLVRDIQTTIYRDLTIPRHPDRGQLRCPSVAERVVSCVLVCRRLVAPLAVVYVAFGFVFGVAIAARACRRPAGSHPASRQTRQSPTNPATASATWPNSNRELDQIDRLAVLEAIHVGLTDAPDGSTYMWRRHNGKIAGSVRPTNSFRDSTAKSAAISSSSYCLASICARSKALPAAKTIAVGCSKADRSWCVRDRVTFRALLGTGRARGWAREWPPGWAAPSRAACFELQSRGARRC